MIILNVTYSCKQDQREAFLDAIKTEGLEDGREAMTHVEPNHDKEHQITNGNMRDLEFFMCLLVEVEVAVHQTEFHEIEVGEMGDETSQQEYSRPNL